MTSIVLTTYNGMKYLYPQLDSLKNQTMPADEVIIVDDCSTDDTITCVEQYIKENGLSTWRLIENQSNMGWKRNFKKGFDLATGDLIFPCDQDDVWCLDKCEKMVGVMKTNLDIDLLACNYNIFFSECDKGSKMYRNVEKGMKNDGSIDILSIDPKWPYIIRPGCTYCFRKSFYNEIRDNWDSSFPHDAILWRYARVQNKVALYNKALIDFRRHGDNATTVKVRTREQRIKDFDDYIFFHKEALKYSLSINDRKIIIKGIDFLKKRKRLYESRNVFRIIPLAIKYHPYYLTGRGILGDLFFCFRKEQVN